MGDALRITIGVGDGPHFADESDSAFARYAGCQKRCQPLDMALIHRTERQSFADQQDIIATQLDIGIVEALEHPGVGRMDTFVDKKQPHNCDQRSKRVVVLAQFGIDRINPVHGVHELPGSSFLLARFCLFGPDKLPPRYYLSSKGKMTLRYIQHTPERARAIFICSSKWTVKVTPGIDVVLQVGILKSKQSAKLR
jgi:hypothetical protein